MNEHGRAVHDLFLLRTRQGGPPEAFGKVHALAVMLRTAVPQESLTRVNGADYVDLAWIRTKLEDIVP